MACQHNSQRWSSAGELTAPAPAYWLFAALLLLLAAVVSCIALMQRSSRASSCGVSWPAGCRLQSGCRRGSSMREAGVKVKGGGVSYA